MRILEYVKKKCKELKAENITTVKFESGLFKTGIFINSIVA